MFFCELFKMLDYVCIEGKTASCQMRFCGCNWYCHSVVLLYVVEICCQVSYFLFKFNVHGTVHR
jgi:hypothetical protein